MDEYMWITLPNEGEIPFNLRNVLNWDITDVNVVGKTVFFKANDSTFSARLEEFEKYFPKLLHN